jgi:hypothetical protein
MSSARFRHLSAKNKQFYGLVHIGPMTSILAKQFGFASDVLNCILCSAANFWRCVLPKIEDRQKSAVPLGNAALRVDDDFVSKGREYWIRGTLR